ncbi:DASH complex subunit Spc19 [Xylaria castorea]|nr:DASH complex subunit Spc19 [Xylaria castorea]
MSTGTGLTGTNTATYSDCVAALRTSLSFLESSVATLESGVSDFPRLVSVLKTARHYELIPQSTLQTAEASLRSDLAPAISTLLDRADAHIDRVDRRVESLKARAELQQGRLINNSDNSHSSSSRHHSGNNNNVKNKGGSGGGSSSTQLDRGGAAKLRARVLGQRREALQYSVERLELEVLQKERELRKRLDTTTTTTTT